MYAGAEKFTTKTIRFPLLFLKTTIYKETFLKNVILLAMLLNSSKSRNRRLLETTAYQPGNLHPY